MRFSIIRFSLVPILLLYFATDAISQNANATYSPADDSVFAGFNQTLSTLNWTGNAQKDWDSGDFSGSINENFHSVMIKSSPNLIRDEQNLVGQANRRIFGSLFGFGGFQSNYVSDNRQIGINSVGSSLVMGGLFVSSGQDSVLVGAGNKWDRQAGVDNSGFTYTLSGGGVFNPVSGAELTPSVQFHDEQIFPRRNTDGSVRLTYGQVFSPEALIRFGAAYVTQLRGFYFPADSTVQTLYAVTNNIQDRNENRTQFTATILMPLWFFELRSLASFAQRQIDFTYRYEPPTASATLYDSRIRTSNFSIHGDLLAAFSDDTLIVAMEHNERSETHGLINVALANPFSVQQSANQAQLNNFGTRNTLSAQLSMNFGNTSVDLTGLASIFRYDTPSALNYDDRDELTNTLAISVRRSFTSEFSAGLGIEADMIHMVYLKSQRSANNNRNFIYRLFPFVQYSGRDLKSTNRFEVLANYTVYDYEAFSQVHSFSFRQASFLDSTAANLTHKLSVLFLGTVKLYTRGELYWSSFSEYPLNYFVDQTLWLSIFYTSGALSYGVGYKYLSLTQYNYTTTKDRQFATEITNSGPTASVQASFPSLDLRLTGWYQVSRQLLQNQIVYPNFEMTATYKI
jgi:hypothetical protein